MEKESPILFSHNTQLGDFILSNSGSFDELLE